jgi:hypothetical protein
MSRKLKLILIAVIVSIALIIWQFSHLVAIWHSFHTLTPKGEKIENVLQLKGDLDHIFRWEAFVDRVDVIPNDVKLLRKVNDKVLEKYANGNHYQVVMSGHHFYQDEYPGNLLQVATQYGIQILEFLRDRKIDDTSISLVRVFFNPRIFDLGGGHQIIVTIPIDEFLKVRDQYKKEGISEIQLEQKLVDYYVKNAET